jgi:hypothetical protein
VFGRSRAASGRRKAIRLLVTGPAGPIGSSIVLGSSRPRFIVNSSRTCGVARTVHSGPRTGGEPTD